jgi:hypothetical protein
MKVLDGAGLEALHHSVCTWTLSFYMGTSRKFWVGWPWGFASFYLHLDGILLHWFSRKCWIRLAFVIACPISYTKRKKKTKVLAMNGSSLIKYFAEKREIRQFYVFRTSDLRILNITKFFLNF